MKVETTFPPNYKAIVKKFPFVKDRKDIVFTYGDTCHNPGDQLLPLHLLVHEKVHVKQQGFPDAGFAKEWWEQYLKDAAFRLSQELEAYRVQYAWLCDQQRNREKLARFLHSFATALCGPIYGNLIGYAEAVKLIRDYDGI